MSPTEDHTNTSSDKSVDTSLTNPFVAFRHFTDNSLSSLFNMVLGSGFLDLPSYSRVRNSKQSEFESPLREIELRNKARLMEAMAASNDMLHQPHQASPGTAACSYMNAEAEHLSSQERADLNTFLSSQRALAQHSDNPGESDTLRSLFLPPSRPFIPLHYLFHNPYSPLHLEQEDPSVAYRTGWRAAFEDLIYVQNGQGLSEYPDEASNSAEPPLDWIRNMIHLSFSKPRRNAEADEACLKRRRGGIREDDGDETDADDWPSTEADLYQRLNDDERPQSRAAKSRVLAHLRQDVSHDNAGDSSGTSLLSTLTTTEKTTLSDGTVHTKMLLKKRFADGREESTETSHTQKAVSRNETKRTELNDSTKGQLEGGKETKGWFWS